MKCYKCPTETGSVASILCEQCHLAEMIKIHQHDTPDTPEVPTQGKYEPPAQRVVRPNNDGRRVIKKPIP